MLRNPEKIGFIPSFWPKSRPQGKDYEEYLCNPKIDVWCARHSSEIAVFDSSALSERGFQERELVGGKTTLKRVAHVVMWI